MRAEHPNFDAWLDGRLREVPAPPGLWQRLRQIPVASDRELDAALRDVPVPRHLQARLERFGRRRARLMQVGQTALATSLVIAIGLCYVGAMLGFGLTVYRLPGAPPPRLISQATLRLVFEPPEVRQVGQDHDGETAGAFDPGETSGLDTAQLAPNAPEFTLVAYRPPPHSVLSEMRQFFAGPDNPSGLDPTEDRLLAEWRVLFAPGVAGALPELEEPPALVRKGVQVPLIDGVDARCLIQTGFNPFISPSAHTRLQSFVVPLAADTSSYDLAREFLRQGRLPPPDQLRTEEFLAAIDYGLPCPEDEAMGLHMMGGPSPFWPGNRWLLQVGVRGREIPDGDRPGTHLTLAVDVSASMGREGRLEIVRRAVRRLGQRIAPEDRISLVTFSQHARLIAEDMGREANHRLHAAIDSLALADSTDMVAGLRQAYAVAYRKLGDQECANRVVLLTDALTSFDHVTAQRLQERLAEPVARGITLHIIRLRGEERYGQVNAALAGFAHAGGGTVHWVTNTDQLVSVLRGILTGKPQLVAREAGLKVTFDPRSVAAYRLLGHEVADVPAEAEVDFYAGQTAVALFEVQLKPTAKSEVAAAELTWRDPSTGQPGVLTRRIRRGQFALTMTTAALSVQAAAVAAEAAEVLQRSPFVQRGSMAACLARVSERARYLDPRLCESPAIEELVQLLKQAQTIRPYRSGGRR